MEPGLRQNQLVLASGWLVPTDGSIVVAVIEDGVEVVKRLSVATQSLSGDNQADSQNYSLDRVVDIATVLWPVK